MLVLLVVVAPLAGCSGASNDTADPTSTATTTPTATATETAVSTATQTATQIQQTAVPTETEAPAQAPTTTPPTSTATPTPEPTSTATPTPEPTPTATPKPDSPIVGGDVRQATVTRVVDRNTVEVTFSNGETDTIRLIGVDTPETVSSNENPAEYGIPDTTQGRDWLLNWGDEAQSFAQDELDGSTIRVVTDPKGDERGSYGRLLAYIYDSDGTNVNRELLEQGLARRYDTSQFTLREEFGQIETNAQSENRGLWAFEQQSTLTSTQTPPSGDSSGATPTPPADGDYDCSDFDTHSQAQQVFEDAGGSDDDPYRLDGDGDGQACESL